jgi:hypothetical protein
MIYSLKGRMFSKYLVELERRLKIQEILMFAIYQEICWMNLRLASFIVSI